MKARRLELRRGRSDDVTTATQFGSRKFRELFSCSAHFLHFFARRIFNALTAFLRFLLAKKGERCMKQAVHRVGSPSRSSHRFGKSPKNEKVRSDALPILGAAWPRDGLERPHFFLARAPKKVCGVVPAHTRARKVSTMQMSAISIP